MKARIVFFDQFALELSVRRTDDGGTTIRGIYPKFLGRPDDPHITWIFEARGGQYTPHFSAKREDRRLFRHDFPAVPEEVFVRQVTRYGEGMAREFARTVEAVDLNALERDGWTIHWMDRNAVRRWMRPAARHGEFGEFRVDVQTIASFVLHVVRTAALPSALKSVPVDQYARCVLIRFSERDELDVRSLFHYPDGYGCRTADGDIALAHGPGWYSQASSFGGGDDVSGLLPEETVTRVRGEIQACLARFPRAGESVDLSGLPHAFPWLLGFFGDELLHLMVTLRYEAIEERKRSAAE